MTKCIKYLLLIVVFPLFSFGKDQMPTLFEKGNQQYAKGQYKEAISMYQKVLTNGYQSAEIYFNMGNAYYKIGEIPSALLYYEKAYKLKPGDDDINFNIQIANLKTTDKIEATPEFFLTKWWKATILAFSVSTLSFLSILFFLAGSAILCIYLFAYSVTIKKVSFYTGILLLFFGLVTIFLSHQQHHYFDNYHQAIIFNGAVTVKSEPVQTSKDLFVVHSGTKVEILESNMEWMKIKLPNGNEGWIISASAKEV